MKVFLSLGCFVLGLDAVRAQDAAYGSTWNLKDFKSLVTFGDSYTDENRMNYFYQHNGRAPPVGWQQPVGLQTSSGGRIWPRYVVQYTTPSVNLYNYAVSGGVCSNEISPRFASNEVGNFPSVKEYEISAYIADSNYTLPNGTKFLDDSPDSTIYAIWIGGNDLGNNAFLTDSQVKGKTLVDYLSCVYENFDALYAHGGRYFVVMNVEPLQLLPQYATPERGGVTASKYFPNKGANITEISYRMLESVVTVNDIYKYRTPFEVAVSRRYPDSHFAVFDTFRLLEDIYFHPEDYLNGTAPLNVTGWINRCDLTGSNCVQEESPDSFMWFDELHPSEQTQRIVAREFVEVASGRSKYATYW